MLVGGTYFWLGLRFYLFLIGLECLLGESRGIALLLSVYLGTRWGWVVSTTPRPPCPRERPGAHFTGGWVCLGAGMDRCGKISPPPGFDPRTSQPVASRYTDYAISAPELIFIFPKSFKLSFGLTQPPCSRGTNVPSRRQVAVA